MPLRISHLRAYAGKRRWSAAEGKDGGAHVTKDVFMELKSEGLGCNSDPVCV